MATGYIVSNTDLMAIADAIRAKTKSSDALVFPDGFISAIGELDEKVLRTYIFKEGTGAVSPMSVTKQTNGSATIANSGITISRSSNDTSCAVVMTTSAIDLTKYNTLTFDLYTTVTDATNYQLLAGAFSARPSAGAVSTTNAVAYKKVAADNAQKLYTIDVSDISGSRYIGIVGTGKTTVYNIYLE